MAAVTDVVGRRVVVGVMGWRVEREREKDGERLSERWSKDREEPFGLRLKVLTLDHASGDRAHDLLCV